MESAMETTLFQIATATAAMLAPFAPYLLEGVKGVVKSLGEGVGKSAFESARTLWTSVEEQAPDEPLIQGSMQILSVDPERKSAQETLADGIAAQLKKSPEFASKLLDLLGGEDGLQVILANPGSVLNDIHQEMHGGGTQKIVAGKGSTLTGIFQKKS
jgi:hypothetical protein